MLIVVVIVMVRDCEAELPQNELFCIGENVIDQIGRSSSTSNSYAWHFIFKDASVYLELYMCCEVRGTNPSGLASPLESRLFSQWGFNRIIGRIEMGPLKLEDLRLFFAILQSCKVVDCLRIDSSLVDMCRLDARSTSGYFKGP